MAGLSIQPYKGTRDFYPEDMRLRRWMFNKWREVCEQFGYEEYDGPILEPLELFSAKTSDEIVNDQSYSFTDRGGRQVIMRPEMTPTVSRMVAARRQELGYPLRLYSIPNCFRYERPQKGRLREFWQLNADLFGVEGIEADVEIIQLADAVLRSFGAKPIKYKIEISSRALLDELAEKTGIKDKKAFIQLVDTKDKMSAKKFEGKLEEFTSSKDNAQTANYVLNLKSLESVRTGLNFSSLDKVRQIILKLEDLLPRPGPALTNIVFNPATARGFDYYTDIVFEVFDTNPENNRSMFGGGRYDGLVGLFGVEPVPTVGFGMGDATLMNFLESNKLLEDLKPTTDLVMILIGDVYGEASKLASKMRAQGLNVSIDATDRKLDKKIKSADKQGVNHALFIGESELKSQVYNLKDLASGKEQKLNLEQVISTLKN